MSVTSFVHSFVRLQNPSLAWNHHPTSLIIQPSSFFIHSSSFFIHPSFISRLLSFSACWILYQVLSCSGSNSERSSSSIVASRLDILFKEFGKDPNTVLRWLGSVSERDIWDDVCLDTWDIGDACCDEDGDVCIVAMDECTRADSSSDTVSLFAKYFVNFTSTNCFYWIN